MNFVRSISILPDTYPASISAAWGGYKSRSLRISNVTYWVVVSHHQLLCFYSTGKLNFHPSSLEKTAMASRKTGKGNPKKRVQRATSNVFAMFDQAQIQEFKEAFNMIDQNRDGFIDKDDLHDMFASLGMLRQRLTGIFSFKTLVLKSSLRRAEKWRCV